MVLTDACQSLNIADQRYFGGVLQRTGNPEKYLDVKTSENGVSLVLPTNNAANVFTDNSLEARSW